MPDSYAWSEEDMLYLANETLQLKGGERPRGQFIPTDTSNVKSAKGLLSVAIAVFTL